MRKTIALKTLLRAPLKTALTFLLIASASFALFSRVTDYAVTMRENKEAEGFYHAVASLDNYVPASYMETEYVSSPDGTVSTGYGFMYHREQKPEPTKEQMEEFQSLPGVTLVNTMRLAAGRVEDYMRLPSAGAYGGYVMLEGTYMGYEDANSNPSILRDHVDLKFDDVRVIDCGGGPEIPRSFTMKNMPLGEMYYAKSPLTRAFYDGLKIGCRCLVTAINTGYRYESDGDAGIKFYPQHWGAGALRVIDGEPDNYLETASFALQKSWLDVIEHNKYVYDIAYTADMRAIRRFHTQSIVISEGRLFTEADKDVCVVSAEFLEAYGLSVGDRIRIRLGDQIYRGEDGALAQTSTEDAKLLLCPEKIPEYVKTAEVTIVGAYADAEKNPVYTVDPNTIYLPQALMPKELEDDEPGFDNISVFVEDAGDIEAFYQAAEELAGRIGCDLNISDRGWMDVKDSFRMGALTSLLTAILYVSGAALALLLAVYLYIGRNQSSYAVMRTLGVPGSAAGSAVVLPFVAVSILAIPIGGLIGLSYAQGTAAETFARMSDSAPPGYVPDASLPVGVILMCLLLELSFVSLSAYYFLRNMKKAPPLALLQEGPARKKAAGRRESAAAAEESVFVKIDTKKFSAAGEYPPQGNYSSVRHTAAYIRRHMRRSVGKTAVSLALAAALASGIGALAMAKTAYRDAFYELGVKGSASAFSFTAVKELLKSPLVKDLYCEDTFGVRMEGTEEHSIMTVASDLMRCMGEGCKVTYIEGYDISAFDGTGQVCLAGKELADKLGISPGDEIGLLADNLYSFLEKGTPEGEAVSGYKRYKVIGIVESDDANVGDSIYAGIRSDLPALFGMEFDVDNCTFVLADNERVDELEALLTEKRDESVLYSPGPSYHLDTGGLIGMRRIRTLLESLFPIAVMAAVLIGIFGPLLVILQSAQEAAYLRILGTTKKRVRCMLVFEQGILCLAGMILAAAGFAIYSPRLFAGSFAVLAPCLALYLLGSVCGAFAAAVLVTRHKALELL